MTIIEATWPNITDGFKPHIQCTIINQPSLKLHGQTQPKVLKPLNHMYSVPFNQLSLKPHGQTQLTVLNQALNHNDMTLYKSIKKMTKSLKQTTEQ